VSQIDNVKIALPKGRLLAETATLLEAAGWGLSGYHKGMPSYRPKSQKSPNLLTKVFQEKDIPIQVAVGNYDLGICGLDWIEELLVKYPSSALVKLRNLGYGEGTLYVVASRSEANAGVEEMKARKEVIRLASEYPNMAESFALDLRLKRFSVFPLWGAAEVYPPESADLALIAGGKEAQALNHDLVPLSNVIDFSAYLIVNKDSWEKKDLSQILASIDSKLPVIEGRPIRTMGSRKVLEQYPVQEMNKGTVRLALRDGHQQQPTIELLNRAGIEVVDYPSAAGNRRPTSNLEGVGIKVIRPQDMPLQVANGNFDLAITGNDWLREHLYQFPSSPVAELLDLKFGWVRIVAVVSKELPASDIDGLNQLFAERSASIRVASEYTNIADEYARNNHFGLYRIIPTWGASEAFLPEDADLLIENTQTGRTIARHNLRIIDTLFESTACLIGNRDSIADAAHSAITAGASRALFGLIDIEAKAEGNI
jgi:ATP phosphoribosyltransferase